jgi:hypothetical protein
MHRSSFTGTGSVDGITAATMDGITALDVMAETNTTSLYNALRPGPSAVRWEYIGRLDLSSGVVSAGINYSFVTPASGTGNVGRPNGLLPDLNYTTTKAVEDCPFRVTTAVTNNIDAIFIPHDTDTLNMRSPSYGNSNMQQRLFIMVSNAEPNQKIGRIKIMQNWETKPNSSFSDQTSTFIVHSPPMESFRDAMYTLVQNGLVIRASDDGDFGLNKIAKIIAK